MLYISALWEPACINEKILAVLKSTGILCVGSLRNARYRGKISGGTEADTIFDS
jgi:hypothetical protein